jgi:sortase B
MSRKRKNISLLVALCVVGVNFALTLHEINEQQREYAEAQAEYTNLREIAGIPMDSSTKENTNESQRPGIDFDALFAINPDVVGWIAVPDTNISYPIVQGKDNQHYLHHTASGVRNASGAVFLDYRDAPEFQGTARIFAHNMQDGSMFASLLHWQGEVFAIHTVDGAFIFDVTSRGAVATSNAVFSANYTDCEIILVTCINGRSNQRFIVCGKLRNPLRDTLSQGENNN